MDTRWDFNSILTQVNDYEVGLEGASVELKKVLDKLRRWVTNFMVSKDVSLEGYIQNKITTAKWSWDGAIIVQIQRAILFGIHSRAKECDWCGVKTLQDIWHINSEQTFIAVSPILVDWLEQFFFLKKTNPSSEETIATLRIRIKTIVKKCWLTEAQLNRCSTLAKIWLSSQLKEKVG